jgi:hypothetical protein
METKKYKHSICGWTTTSKMLNNNHPRKRNQLRSIGNYIKTPGRKRLTMISI